MGSDGKRTTCEKCGREQPFDAEWDDLPPGARTDLCWGEWSDCQQAAKSDSPLKRIASLEARIRELESPRPTCGPKKGELHRRAVQGDWVAQELVQARERIRELSEWRPMETAPRGGVDPWKVPYQGHRDRRRVGRVRRGQGRRRGREPNDDMRRLLGRGRGRPRWLASPPGARPMTCAKCGAEPVTTTWPTRDGVNRWVGVIAHECRRVRFRLEVKYPRKVAAKKLALAEWERRQSGT